MFADPPFCLFTRCRRDRPTARSKLPLFRPRDRCLTDRTKTVQAIAYHSVAGIPPSGRLRERRTICLQIVRRSSLDFDPSGPELKLYFVTCYKIPRLSKVGGGRLSGGLSPPEGGRSGEGAERLRTGGTAGSPPVMFVGGPTKSEQAPTPFLAIKTIRWQSNYCKASLPVEHVHP